jgi:formamidopyrimidine-DNA glycosylase
MPELPEVETIKNCLLPQVVGHHFTGVTLLWPRLVRQPSPEEFCQKVAGQTIKDVSRRGKYLLFHLSSRERLILHLKMTGVLLLQLSSAPVEPRTRAILHLDNGSDLRFRDQRKFGAMWLIRDEMAVLGKLGVEPLSDDFTPEGLAKLLQRHAMPIKALLFDQNIIAGIGNMYADEALFAARINPLKRTKDLSARETKRLHQAIRQVLTAAIGRGGASVNTYQQPDGQLGTAHFFFKVAHRRGERCYVCHAPIERLAIRGRGTYFCPNCQKP